MSRISLILMVFAVCLWAVSAQAQLDPQAARALVQRVLPDHHEQFEIEELPTDGEDAFEIESRDGRIVLRGNNGVSVASALNHYLRHVTHSDISWNGTNLNLSPQLPPVEEVIRRESPYTACVGPAR